MSHTHHIIPAATSIAAAVPRIVLIYDLTRLRFRWRTLPLPAADLASMHTSRASLLSGFRIRDPRHIPFVRLLGTLLNLYHVHPVTMMHRNSMHLHRSTPPIRIIYSSRSPLAFMLFAFRSRASLRPIIFGEHSLRLHNHCIVIIIHLSFLFVRHLHAYSSHPSRICTCTLSVTIIVHTHTRSSISVRLRNTMIRLDVKDSHPLCAHSI
jgi:hypothetical protein